MGELLYNFNRFFVEGIVGGIMEGYVYIGFVVVIAIVFAIQSYRSSKEKQRKLDKYIDKNYGNIPEREYSEEELKRIASLYENFKESYSENIDDITWNDLNMDEVFFNINNTYSSMGEEYLYMLLRTPREKDELEEFNKMVSGFEKDEENTKEIQKLFCRVGRSKKISFFDFIHRLGDLGRRSNLIHYIQIVAFIASTIFLIVNPPVGVVFFIVVLAYNVITYYSQKSVIENYFVCFKYLIGMNAASKKLESLLSEDFAEYKNNIKQINKNLQSMQKGLFLISDGMSGSITEIIMDYLRMIFHLDIIKFNSMLNTTNAHIEDIDNLYLCMGRIEAAIAVASYKKYLKNHYGYLANPDIDYAQDKHINFNDIYHPLISNPVSNSIFEKRGVLLTGSNASGKSTFLKTVAINVILSRTIYIATARNFEISPFRIFSSMSLRDDLKNNESYYIVEIKALKRIIDAANDEKPMICFVDEVLRGTNTVERIAASSEILKSLCRKNVICFAATHDIELTHILENYYSNYHFEETVLDDDIKFNYILNKGRATTRNAIKLLKIIGYDDNIINKAKELADKFMNTGSW